MRPREVGCHRPSPGPGLHPPEDGRLVGGGREKGGCVGDARWQRVLDPAPNRSDAIGGCRGQVHGIAHWSYAWCVAAVAVRTAAASHVSAAPLHAASPPAAWPLCTPAGRHACRYLVCDPGEVIPQNDWGPNCEKIDAALKPPARGRCAPDLTLLPMCARVCACRCQGHKDGDGGANASHIGEKVDNPFAIAPSKL